MQKEFEKHQKLEAMDEAHKKEYMEAMKKEEEAKKHHQPVIYYVLLLFFRLIVCALLKFFLTKLKKNCAVKFNFILH